VEVIPKSDQTMPRYPECVWSGAEKLEHIEIVRRCGKSSEAAKNVGRCGKMSEASDRVAGDRKDSWKACVTDQVMSQYVTVLPSCSGQ